MKIRSKSGNTVSFADLKGGDVFKSVSSGKIYIKMATENVGVGLDIGSRVAFTPRIGVILLPNAVLLTDGEA